MQKQQIYVEAFENLKKTQISNVKLVPIGIFK